MSWSYSRQRSGRQHPPGNHKPQGWRAVIEEVGPCRMHIWVDDGVEIIEDQCARQWIAGDLIDYRNRDRFWRLPCCVGVQYRSHIQQEPAHIVIGVIQRESCSRFRMARHPIAEEHGLAAARRGGDQRERSRNVQPCKQARARIDGCRRWRSHLRNEQRYMDISSALIVAFYFQRAEFGD